MNPSTDPQKSALDWAHAASLGPELAVQIRLEVRRRHRQRIVGWGTLGILLFTTSLWWGLGGPGPASENLIASTSNSAAVLQPSQQVLPDGSVVELRVGGAIRVEYSPEVRRVVLEQGVAHFQVEKSTLRPFVVVAEEVQVRAVGTAFSVGLDSQVVEVMVTEGVVALHQGIPNSEPSSSSQTFDQFAEMEAPLLVAGQQALITRNEVKGPAVQNLSADLLAHRLSWRVPRLDFTGTPLSEVIVLFARHGGVTLTLDDPSLGEVRVSGILRANNTEALLSLLAADHGIQATQDDSRTVLRWK